MKIPLKFIEILNKNQVANSIILDVITSFEPIFNDNKLYFFEEFTDHGINHIEKVLESAEFIISDASFDNINANEVAVLILSIILHDLGMHIELSTFKSMLKGDYDSVKINSLDNKTWSELWEDYLNEVKRFSTIQKKNIFGNENIHFKIPDLDNKDNLTGHDKKLIGEFIRRYHGRLAHEIALIGLIGEKDTIYFGTEKLDIKNKQLAGILARSHSMNIRDTFSYLEEIAHDSWRNPQGINIVFLMVILRIADYIQIDSNRVNPYLLKIKSFNSPISQLEFITHLSITHLNFNQPDSEKIYADCYPKNSEQFVKIKNLIKDIQNELDISWATLGEIYGFIPKNKPSIKFRRITSNLYNKKFLKELNYVPEKITFKVDHNLSKLLVAPLYGDNPTFGARELLQNAIDSCLERKDIEYQKNNYTYKPSIKILINRIDEDKSLFTISDNGKGMNDSEIINYFLNVGTSFRKSMEWKKKFVDEEGNSRVSRNGKFGIGVLASFLLGNKINVTSRSISNDSTYSFEANIDSQFINLSKDKHKEDFGVEISILVDNAKRDKLMSKNTSYYDKSIYWTKWYIYDEPQISYIIDGVEEKIINEYSDKKYFNFKTENFEKISWTYSKIHKFGSSSSVVCNGIIITENYSPNRFKYHIEKNHHQYLINHKPTILITDKEGIFPVKLDRNDIDCEEFPFEKDLMNEVSKHFIAQLLNVDIDIHNLHKTKVLHDPNFLFGKEGFIINCDYFINGVKNNFDFIRIITEKNNLQIDFQEYKNALFSIDFNEKLKLSYQETNIAPRGGGRILLPKYNYETLFRSKTKRIAKYIKDSAVIEEETDKYVLFRILGHKKEATILNKIANINQDLLSKAESIQEISSEYFTIKNGEILKDFFSKYIKEDYIIPYDLKKRKEIYKEAFNELEYYMNK
jgi:hypothetical protein